MNACIRPGLNRRSWNAAALPPAFDLVRWFAGLGLLCILATACGTALQLGHFLTDQLLRHDAEVSAEYLDSLVRAEQVWSYFSDPASAAAREPLERFFGHLTGLPSVVRANVFAPDGAVLWSNEPELIGRRFPANEELAEALADRIAVKFGNVVDLSKPEHLALGRSTGTARFMEAYLPVHGPDAGTVIGVIEIYRIPHALFESIDAGVRRVWLGAGLGALLLYGALLWIAVRARRTIQAQQARLIEGEGLATLGAIASAVAHGVRNPLASMRSSAELAAEEEEAAARRECLADILRQADRMEGWVRDLLMQARGDLAAPGAVDVNALLRESLRGFAPQADRRQIRMRLRAMPALPPARGNPGALTQAVENLIGNAIDAMPEGGELDLRTGLDPEGAVEIRIADRGPGLPKPLAHGTAPPFFSTKPEGTGLGLILVRRILAGYGGSLRLESRPGHGTLAVVSLPVATK